MPAARRRLAPGKAGARQSFSVLQPLQPRRSLTPAQKVSEDPAPNPSARSGLTRLADKPCAERCWLSVVARLS